MDSSYLKDTEFARKFERIFNEFAIQEVREGRDLPDEASNFVLKDFIHHIESLESTDMTDNELDELLERFEAFLHFHRPVKSTQPELHSINESLTIRHQRVIEAKAAELRKTLDGIQRLIDIKNNFQLAFESSAKLMELKTESLNARIELLRTKILKYLLYKTPETRKAFEKLNKIVHNEKDVLEKHVVTLEQQFKNYKEIDDDQQYQILLKQWKKLQHEKQLLSVDETDVMHSFSYLSLR